MASSSSPLDTLMANLRANGLTDALSFVTGNYAILGALGLVGLQEVLEALQHDDSEAAQNALDKNMTTDQLIEAEMENADNKQQATANREAFLATAKSVAIALLPEVLKLVPI